MQYSIGTSHHNGWLFSTINAQFTMNSQSDRRSFLTLGGLAAAGSALHLNATALPTPATEDAHGYVNYLQANGKDIVPEGKWKPTHPDILGPFWASGAPFRGKVTPPLEPGELLVIRGRVWSHKTKKPLANTVLDVWQADIKGRYDFQDSPATDARPLVGGKQPKRTDFKNRIRLLTDEAGYYEYETIKPASYQAGSQIRPSHIHYMAQAGGHQRLITQIYFKGDKHIAQDPWASKSPLIINLQKEKCAKGTYLAGHFDLVLAPAGA